MAVRYVVFYDSAPDVASKAPLHYAEHRARVEDFHARGLLELVGMFANVQDEGSMAIFTTRAAAEEFVAGDPFVRHGVVRSWRLREWHEALGPP